jgi:hypothetical protein
MPAPFPLTGAWLNLRMAKDLILAWPVSDLAGTTLRYPLRPCPDDPYHELQIHLCPDYVYHCSELIDPLTTEVRCPCGESLEFGPPAGVPDVFYSGRIHFICPSCGKEFQPEQLTARVRNAWTGEELGLIAGAAIYRFAIIVDCGKCLPPSDTGAIDFEPDLVALCQTQLGCSFYQVNDLY